MSCLSPMYSITVFTSFEDGCRNFVFSPSDSNSNSLTNLVEGLVLRYSSYPPSSTFNFLVAAW